MYHVVIEVIWFCEQSMLSQYDKRLQDLQSAHEREIQALNDRMKEKVADAVETGKQVRLCHEFLFIVTTAPCLVWL